MKKFKFWCKGTSTNKNFNKAGWWTYPNYLLNKYFYGLDIFESPDFEVCQWTGLVDKNGVEIYEGDIVQEFMEDKEGDYIKTTCIEFVNGSYLVDSDDISSQLSLYHNFVTVVGNKFENPELLK